MSNRDYLDQNLRKLFESVEPRLRMSAEQKAEVLDQLLQEAEMPTKHKGTHVPWIKLAAAAMILVAIVLGVCLMNRTGIAFADVLDNLQRRGYTFTYWVAQQDGELKKIGRGMVLQPGLIRWDMPDDQWKGLALVIDAVNHKTRWVTTSGKSLGEVEMPNDAQDDTNWYDGSQNFMLGPVEELWGLVDGTEETLGETTKDGVRVTGYRVEKAFEINSQKGTVTYTIWANASTAMPHEVKMEVTDPNEEDVGFSTVLRDFDFDAKIDESLFGLGPAPTTEGVKADRLVIEPGVGMADLPLGADKAKIEEVLGSPDFMIGDDLYQYTGLVVVAREGNVYAFHCGDANKSDSPHVTGCTVRTKEGIGMGSTEQDVIGVYGEPTRKRNVSSLQGAEHWLYRETGTVLGFHEGKIYYMIFQQPKQSENAGRTE